MMSDVILIGAAAAFGGVLAGAFGGAWFADRRMRRRVEEVGVEVLRLKKVAEEKLLDDDPDLPDLLRNLNKAVEQAYRAVDALEDQSALTKRKTEAAKEVVASSRHIVRMMDEMGAEMPYVSPANSQIIEAEASPEPKAPPELR